MQELSTKKTPHINQNWGRAEFLILYPIPKLHNILISMSNKNLKSKIE